MAFHFKIVLDQDGTVLGVEPPQGTILKCNGIDSETAKNETKDLKLSNIPLKVDILKNENDPCVRVGGKLWCW